VCLLPTASNFLFNARLFAVVHGRANVFPFIFPNDCIRVFPVASLSPGTVRAIEVQPKQLPLTALHFLWVASFVPDLCMHLLHVVKLLILKPLPDVCELTVTLTLTRRKKH
jgi:hypothetical protein